MGEIFNSSIFLKKEKLDMTFISNFWVFLE